MTPDVVVLADAGHVRDGLLYVIGGGIDQVYTNSLPAVMQMTIVARVHLDPSDYNKEHALTLTVRQESGGDPIAEMQGRFVTKRPASTLTRPGFATAIKLDGMALPDYGPYLLTLEIDGELMKEFRLMVSKREALLRRSSDTAARRSSANPTVRPKSPRRKR